MRWWWYPLIDHRKTCYMSADLEIQRAKRIFDQAVEMPDGERVAFLERACGGDVNVYRRAQSMLLEFESGSTATGQHFLKNSSLPSLAGEEDDFDGTTRFA